MPHRDEFEQWFRQYSQDIYHFLIYYTGSPDVDDLVQDVFIKAYQSIYQYQGRSGVKTWLMKIARNQAIDQSRKSQRFTPLLPHCGARRNRGLKPLLKGRKLWAFYHATFQMKESYRVVLLLRLLEECSVEETAEILNWKTSKVTLTYHRALKKLRTIFPVQEEEENSYGQPL